MYDDGCLHLHTRGRKYGKVANGQLLQVPSTLVRRQKQHFHTFYCAGCWLLLVLGVNGLVWISPVAAVTAPPEGERSRHEKKERERAPTAAERTAMCTVRCAVLALAAAFSMIDISNVERLCRKAHAVKE